MNRTEPGTRRTLHRIGRLIRAVLALAALLGLTIGIPAALVLTVGSPIPEHGVSLAEIGAALGRQLDDATLMRGIAVIAWIAWFVMLFDIAAEIRRAVHDLRSGTAPAVRPTIRSPMRIVAAILVGAIAGAILTDLIRSAATVRTPAPDASDAAARTVAVAQTIETSRPRLNPPTGAPPPRAAAHDERRPVPSWAAGAPGGVHHVVKGDNLWDIAEAHLGNPMRWREIYVLNRNKPQANGYALTDPGEIHVGWTLALPGSTHPAVPPAGAPPATTDHGATGQPARPSAPTPAVTDAASPPTTLAPTAPATAPQTPRTPAFPPTAAPASTPAAHVHAEHSTSHGVTLPSEAWISFGLAAAIAATATTVRLMRRRHARLRHLIDTSLDPTPTPIGAALAAADDAGLAFTEPMPDPYEPDAAAIIPAPLATPIPVAIDAHGNDVSLYDLPHNGIALTGDGALAAARAVIAAALTTDPQHNPALFAPMVVTTRETLRQLLPEGTESVPRPQRPVYDADRLIVLADTAAAVAHLEVEMIRRRRELDTAFDHAGQRSPSIAALNDSGHDHDEPAPPYVLVIPADDQYDARLRAATADRDALHLHPVIVGASEAIPTYKVDTGGMLHPAAGRATRVATLAADDLTAALALVTASTAGPEDGTDFEEDPPPVPPYRPTPAVPAPATGSHPPVHLHVFGSVSLSTAEGAITTGIRSGSYTALAYLAAHPEGRTLSEISEALYPDRNPTNAANAVRTDINSLRRALRDATGRSNKGGFITHDQDRYRIDPDAITVDLWQMLTAIDHANNANEDAEALPLLQAAAGLYRGDYAKGIDRTWVVDQATTHRNQYLNALTRIAEILEVDAPDHAAAALEQAIHADPINEELYQRLMRIHGRRDRIDAVRRTYRLLENRLADLGMAEPSQATVRLLHRQIPQRQAM